MKKIIYLLVATVTLTSCAGKKEEAKIENAPTEEILISEGSTNLEDAVLNYSAFKVIDDSGMSGFEVNEKGEVLIEKQVVGSIDRASGTLKNVEGNVVVALDENGSFYATEKNEKLITINADGSVDNKSGKLIKWSETGELMNGEEATGIKIVPADQKSYKAASILVFLYLNGNKF